MAKEVKVWYDQESDYLEVIFEQEAGYFKDTENDAIMEKVNQDGKILGFSIMNLNQLKQISPLSISLK